LALYIKIIKKFIIYKGGEMKKILTLGIMLALCIILTFGCGTPASTTTTTTSASKYGGTLTIAAMFDATSLYPPYQQAPEDMQQGTPALESLLRPAGGGLVEPFLAESYTADPVGLSYTFKLRQGVKFQDDTPFNAEAVKWNIEQFLASPVSAPSLPTVTTVDVVDEYTVRVNMNAWDSVFPATMTAYPMVSPTAFNLHGREWMDRNPIGTGPFKLTNWTRDVSKTYEKWDGYWQEGKPYLDKIIFKIIADPTTQQMSFLNHECDIITGVSPNDALTLQSNPEVAVVYSKISGALEGLMGDSANPDSPFAKLEVRQAMSYAIDRQAIVDAVFKGFGIATLQFNTPACYSYNPDLVGYPYNPEKARQLLKDAGYEDGFSIPLIYKSSDTYQSVYTAVQSMLAEVGIRVDLQQYNAGKYSDTYFGSGWLGNLFGSDMLSYPEWGDSARWFFDADSCVPGCAVSIIHPQDVNDLVKAVNAAPDLATKTQLAQQLQTLVFETYCVITPICMDYMLSAKSVKIHDEYTGSDFGAWSYANAWIEK
jgi:peptide/nickel transport system substrate-binding protein